MTTCFYCHHDDPAELVRSADAHGNLIYECADGGFCDLRAWMRGLHTGLHIEGVR